MPKPPSTDAVPAVPDVLLVVGDARTPEPLAASTVAVSSPPTARPG